MCTPDAQLVAPHEARGLHGLVELAGFAVEGELVGVGVAALGAEELGVAGAGEDDRAVVREAECERRVVRQVAAVLGLRAEDAGPGLAVVDELAGGGEVGGGVVEVGAEPEPPVDGTKECGE